MNISAVIKRFSSALLVISLGLLTVSSHPPPQTLQVGIVDSPPFIVIHENQKPSGIMPAIMGDLVESCNIKLQYHFFSLKRFYDAVEKGEKAQLQFIIKGIERIDKNLIYSQYPVLTIKLNLYWYQDNENVEENFNLSSLENQSVVVMRGFHYAGLTQRLKRQFKSIEFIEVDSVTSAFKMLSSKRAKFVLQYERIVQDYIDNSGKKSLLDNVHKKNLNSLDYFISVHRSVDHADEILHCLSMAHQQLE